PELSSALRTIRVDNGLCAACPARMNAVLAGCPASSAFNRTHALYY
ncbi:9333_t:CDS:2, partial [Acaulospora colombiana]